MTPPTVTDAAPAIPARAGSVTVPGLVPSRWIGPSATATATLAVIGVMHVFDPNQPSLFPTCPWLAMTGTWCPGCGSTRALHALSHGDLGTALERNPLAVALVTVLLGIYLRWVVRVRSGSPRSTAAPAWVLWSFLGLVLAYWLARNIPGWTWLSPA